MPGKKRLPQAVNKLFLENVLHPIKRLLDIFEPFDDFDFPPAGSDKHTTEPFDDFV